MSIIVKLDFANPYNIDAISDDLRISTFQTELQDGSYMPLKVEINREPHELVPTVYNLAFGPVNDRGEIDDKAEIHHKDYSKVFSSILMAGLTYLTHNDHH